jgi:hypothetical protein
MKIEVYQTDGDMHQATLAVYSELTQTASIQKLSLYAFSLNLKSKRQELYMN